MSATDDSPASTTAPPPGPGTVIGRCPGHDRTVTGAAFTSERADLLAALRGHRAFLLQTLTGLTDEQAGLRTTMSTLYLGGIVEHVAATEEQWAGSVVEGAFTVGGGDEAAHQRWMDDVEMLPDETVEEVPARSAAACSRTDALLLDPPDLDTSHQLLLAPWFEPGVRRSTRRVLVASCPRRPSTRGTGARGAHRHHPEVKPFDGVSAMN